MSERIYNFCLEKRGIFYNQAEKWRGDIAPKARKRLRVNSVLAKDCRAVPDGFGDFRVADHNEGWVHTTSLTTHKCSCRYWQLNGIPCQHALACLPAHEDPGLLVSDYFKKDRYLKTYGYRLECTRGAEMWKDYKGEKIEAPVMRAKPGRPKVKRYKCRDEVNRVSKTKTILSRKNTQQTCGICGIKGHNMRTCKKKK